MRGRVGMLLVAGALGIGASAATAQDAGDAIRLNPNVTGKPTGAHVDVRPPEEAQNADELVVGLPRGLEIDHRARPRHCFDEAAANSDCREDSRIGQGTIEVTARGDLFGGGERKYVADIEIFQTGRREPGDIIGIVVQFDEPQTNYHHFVKGRIVPVASGPYGAEVRIEDLREVARPAALELTVDRVQFTVKAKRAIPRVRHVRRNGRVVRRNWTERRYFLRNPSTCNGSWPFRVTLRSNGGGEHVTDYSAPCAPAR